MHLTLYNEKKEESNQLTLELGLSVTMFIIFSLCRHEGTKTGNLTVHPGNYCNWLLFTKKKSQWHQTHLTLEKKGNKCFPYAARSFIHAACWSLLTVGNYLRLYRTLPSGYTRSITLSVVVSCVKDLLEWTKNMSGTQIFFTSRPSKVMLWLLLLLKDRRSSFQ